MIYLLSFSGLMIRIVKSIQSFINGDLCSRPARLKLVS